MPVSKKRKRAGKTVKRQAVELPVRDTSIDQRHIIALH